MYTSHSEPNSITKELIAYTPSEIYGEFRDEMSVENPVILIEMAVVPRFNYVKINTLNRNYFVTQIKNVRTNLWAISLHVDVLTTYMQQILAQRAFIARNEHEFNLTLPDNKVPADTELQWEAPINASTIIFSPTAAHSTLVVEGLWATPPVTPT